MVSNSGTCMSLKSDLIGSCEVCKGSGFLDNLEACECMKVFRVYNRLLSKGFTRKALDIITNEAYELPVIEEGEQFVNYFKDYPSIAEDKGLCLYMFSKERGRGKTTLAHYLMYHIARHFFEEGNYKSSRTYSFIHAEDFMAQMLKNDDSLWKCDWLVLDDLGNEDHAAEWKRANMISGLQRVLHYRRDRCMPTIITSNYTPGAISTLYKREVDSLLEIKADGHLGGAVIREVSVGGGEDLRLIEDFTSWPI